MRTIHSTTVVALAVLAAAATVASAGHYPDSLAPTCPLLQCDARCGFGIRMDANGCPTCECIDPCENNDCHLSSVCVAQRKRCLTQRCPQYTCVTPQQPATSTTRSPADGRCNVEPCNIRCAFGLKRDENGCQLCECIDPCENNECKDSAECIPEPKVCITEPCLQYRCETPATTTAAPQPVSCSEHSDCGAGQFCFFQQIGNCAGAPQEVLGVCQNRPELCPTVYEPVCGCDGETYSNECVAESAGFNVLYTGECVTTTTPAQEPIACGQNSDCSLDAYCFFEPRGVCPGDDQTGACKNRPDVCTLEYAPVCGCDGRTYGNDCMAAGTGVSVKYTGECESAPGDDDDRIVSCDQHLDCSVNELCFVKAAGACIASDGSGPTGECQVRPKACTKEYVPVCGCNGETFGNDCEAKAAGVNVLYRGECRSGELTTAAPGTVPCRRNSECSAEEFCFFDGRGACPAAGDSGPVGVCETRPQVCTREYVPVCGCDGQTYGNNCVARHAGVNVLYQGECGTSTTTAAPAACGTNSECGAEEYCYFEGDGICSPDGASGLLGQCKVRPDFCTKEYIPVCGCDGETYGNDCVASHAGVNILYQGECEPMTTVAGPVPSRCYGNSDCNTNEYCFLAKEGECLTRDSSGPMGECQDRPEVCTREYRPVCGCDGETYGNDCEAMSAGVNIAYQGECAPTTTPAPGHTTCTRHGDCSAENFCSSDAPLTCLSETGSGTCQVRPEVCTAVYHPVCGCDGETYGNECVARSAGVNVDYTGKCSDFCKDSNCKPGAVCIPTPKQCATCLQYRCVIPTTTPEPEPAVCTQHSDCGPRELCFVESGVVCLNGDNEGMCVDRPEVCTREYIPVCGCDGRTYGNDCEAKRAGANVAYQGECEAEPPRIPPQCVLWFDGCNVCTVVNGQPLICTERFCTPDELEPPMCRRFDYCLGVECGEGETCVEEAKECGTATCPQFSCR